MELRGGSGVVKPMNVDLEDVGLHDTDSSELSASTASNSTLPQLEATDAEKAQNEEERRRKRAARKEKREAREKKKEQQRLEEKKARKEERRLKREARKKEEKQEKRRNKKQKPPIHLQMGYLAAPKMVMMMSPTKCISRRTRKERARRMTIINMPPYPLTILLCL